MACETDPCPVFGFLTHLHSDNGESFIAKISQQCAASQVSVGVSVLSVIHRHPELLSIETPSSKVDKFLTTFSPFPDEHILVRQFGHCIWKSAERNSLFSAALWAIIRTKEVGVIIKNCEGFILLAN